MAKAEETRERGDDRPKIFRFNHRLIVIEDTQERISVVKV
jgi:hypothetical protein